jgi:hypothetical protein
MFAVLRRARMIVAEFRQLCVRSMRTLFVVTLPACIYPSTPVKAVPLPVGGVVTPPNTGQSIGGTILVGQSGIGTPFSAPTFSGSLLTMVIANDRTNPFGNDKLTFLYRLRNDDTSLSELHRFTIGSFANTEIDVHTILQSGVSSVKFSGVDLHLRIIQRKMSWASAFIIWVRLRMVPLVPAVPARY